MMHREKTDMFVRMFSGCVYDARVKLVIRRRASREVYRRGFMLFEPHPFGTLMQSADYYGRETNDIVDTKNQTGLIDHRRIVGFCIWPFGQD